jgi:transcriptional regulator with XRE-family HTH domain
LHRTYVSGIERGERNVGIDNVERLAAALGVEISELFG